MELITILVLVIVVAIILVTIFLLLLRRRNARRTSYQPEPPPDNPCAQSAQPPTRALIPTRKNFIYHLRPLLFTQHHHGRPIHHQPKNHQRFWRIDQNRW